jgi:hypothetical protein
MKKNAQDINKLILVIVHKTKKGLYRNALFHLNIINNY